MTLPEIKKFVPLSCVDWDGKVSAVAFLSRCNLRCPFCYNTALVLNSESLETIPFEEVERSLIKSKGWLDGVVLTGGEPTLNEELPNLCSQIKELGYNVKLDTNGTNSTMVKKLIREELVGYVALDVKAPLNPDAYSRAVGVEAAGLVPEVEKTVRFLLEDSVDYEFRTTLVPGIHDEESVAQICSKIVGCRKYVLQNFVGDVETLEPTLRNTKPFPALEMEKFLAVAKKIVQNTTLR
jgi:pyruvate formate lyase activating enzyme